MRDVRQTRHKLQQLRDNLLSSDSNRCISDLAIFWKFLHSDPFISPILANLKRFNASYEGWRSESGDEASHRGGYSLPDDEDERAALCLEILSPDHFPSDDAIWNLGFDLRLNQGTGGIIDNVIRSVFAAFAQPVYQYVDHLLIERESMVTPADIMLQVSEVLSETTIKTFPNTVEALQTAYRDLHTASGSVIFRNIGNACRAAYIALANEVFTKDMVPPGVDQPKGDDAKQKLAYALRHFWKRTHEPGKYLDALESLARDTWDLINALVHRKDATEDDAKACVMYTYLIAWIVTTKAGG